MDSYVSSLPARGAAIPVERGCGTRQQGGVYFEFGIGPNGRQLEDFLVDPPFVLTSEMAVPDRGVKLIEHAGVWHILDRVGVTNYPNVLDFVEEARRFGVSRKLSPSLDFSKLTEDSRLLLVHERAHIDNYGRYVTEHWHMECPKDVDGHPHLAAMCIAAWWKDLLPSTADREVGAPSPRPGDGKLVWRKMPSFEYVAYTQHARIEPIYRPAIFASLPCSRLVVVKGNDHEAAFERARAASVPVAEVDQ